MVKALTKTRSFQRLRYKLTLRLSKRRNCQYTSFLRLPTQYEALSGPVLDFLVDGSKAKALRILILGCSNGAESYSVASVLKNRHPHLEFHIHAFDLDGEVVSKAKSMRYTSKEVFNNETDTDQFDSFVKNTFDIENDVYHIKQDVGRHVQFGVANVLDSHLKEKIGTADIVYVQHLLIHLKVKDQKKAFRNIHSLLNPKAALFVAGNEYDTLEKLTTKYDLRPLDYNIEQIHSEVGVYCRGWPWVYWGVEPFVDFGPSSKRRYSTIFFKSGNASQLPVWESQHTDFGGTGLMGEDIGPPVGSYRDASSEQERE